MVSPPTSAGRAANDIFHRFRNAVEEEFRVHHDVAYYGRRLGYSPRTLRAGIGGAGGAGVNP